MTGGKAAAATGAKSSGGSSGKPPPKGSGGGKSLQSFPVPTAIEDVEQEEVDEEVHKDEECTIKVGAAAWRRGWGAATASACSCAVPLGF